MLKAADSLHAEGYSVRVVATTFEPWAAETDREVRQRREWPLTLIDYRRTDRPGAYAWSGVRYHAARRAAAIIGAGRIPSTLAARAFGRVHPELVRAATAEPADLVYGG